MKVVKTVQLMSTLRAELTLARSLIRATMPATIEEAPAKPRQLSLPPTPWPPHPDPLSVPSLAPPVLSHYKLSLRFAFFVLSPLPPRSPDSTREFPQTRYPRQSTSSPPPTDALSVSGKFHFINYA